MRPRVYRGTLGRLLGASGFRVGVASAEK